MKQLTLPELVKALRNIRGCLSHLQTKPETAVRKFSHSENTIDCGDPFLDDLRRVKGSKAYRRLRGKTQVTALSHNCHVRCRMTHTGEVVGVASTIADILGLNTNLAIAAAEVHDTGHVPFGHQGEEFLAHRMGKKFCHEVMGVVIAQKIERTGSGLNLTWQTMDCGMRHSGDLLTQGTLPEGKALYNADKIAYLTHDYNDLLRIAPDFVSPELKALAESLGRTQREREVLLIGSLCLESAEKGEVIFVDHEVAQKFKQLRKLMYEVYISITSQNPEYILEPLYDFIARRGNIDPALMIALLTETEIRELPGPHEINWQYLCTTGAWEIMKNFQGKEIDMCDADLGWHSLEAAY